MLVERNEKAVVELDISVTGMKFDDNQNEIGVQKEQTGSVRKQQTDLDGIGIPEIHNSSDVNMARVGESITDVIGKGDFEEPEEKEPMDNVGWIVRRISELGGYENVSDMVSSMVWIHSSVCF